MTTAVGQETTATASSIVVVGIPAPPVAAAAAATFAHSRLNGNDFDGCLVVLLAGLRDFWDIVLLTVTKANGCNATVVVLVVVVAVVVFSGYTNHSCCRCSTWRLPTSRSSTSVF